MLTLLLLAMIHNCMLSGRCCPCPPSSHVTLLTILRARAAKPRVLRVSCRQASEGLMLATITVLALPPMESCKDSIYTIFGKKGQHYSATTTG